MIIYVDFIVANKCKFSSLVYSENESQKCLVWIKSHRYECRFCGNYLENDLGNYLAVSGLCLIMHLMLLSSMTCYTPKSFCLQITYFALALIVEGMSVPCSWKLIGNQ